jgi:hypothetical protein
LNVLNELFVLLERLNLELLNQYEAVVRGMINRFEHSEAIAALAAVLALL